LSSANQQKLTSQLQHVTIESHASSTEQQTTLLRLEERLKETATQVTANNSIALKIKETISFTWFRQLGGELKGMIHKIMAMHAATYKAVIMIQACLPSYLERLLIQEPWILEDAIGRISAIPVQFIESWDAFDAVLEIRFRDVQGFQKVKEKKYILQQHGTGLEVTRSAAFTTAFIGGKRYEMSLLFDGEAEPPAGASCPSCHADSYDLSDAEILW
jgi:hypothetical protein